MNGLSIIMNTLTIVLFVKFSRKLLTTNNNKILLSLATGDLLVGINGMITPILLITNQKILIYKISGILPLFGSMFVSICSLGIMTIDRLVSVKYPLRYHSIMTQWRIKLLIALTWIVPGTLTLIEVLVLLYSTFNTELKVRSCFMFIFLITASLALISSNFVIHRSIFRQQASMMTVSTHSSDRTIKNDTNMVRNERKYAKKTISNSVDILVNLINSRVCIWIIAAFMVCWIPLTAYRFSYVVGRTTALRWLRRLSLCLASANSFLNPCIYFLIRKQFRTLLKRLFCRQGSPTIHVE